MTKRNKTRPDTADQQISSRPDTGIAPIKRKHLTKREETTVLKRIQRSALESSTRTNTQTPHPLVDLSVVMTGNRPNIAPDTTRTRADGKPISRSARSAENGHRKRAGAAPIKRKHLNKRRRNNSLKEDSTPRP